MAYTTYEKEMAQLKEMEDLRDQLIKLAGQVDEAIAQMKYAREKLIEAQERNRKLNWLLTEATEKLKVQS